MKKIAITGANGLVGSELLKHFSNKGNEVLCVARNTSKLPANAESFQISSIDDTTDYGASLVGVDCVIHCAAHCHQVNQGDDVSFDTFNKVNNDGTINLAQQALEAGVRRFVFISTIKVFGEGNPMDKPFRINDVPSPEDAYGISKLQAEKRLLELCQQSSMDCVIIRCPLIYGPGVKANFLALIDLVQKPLILPFKSVKNRRSMLYLGNLVSLVDQTLYSQAAANKVFLASDDEDLSTADIIRYIADALGVAPRLMSFEPRLLSWLLTLIGKKAIADRVLGSLSMDVSQTKQVLQWQPPYSVREGVQATINASRTNR